ncbi:MAG TPA: aspartate aminotransferase family protein [Roseomonas sp.]|nr:aspartate aminotransferase family protein [Roseomonas sp.]
MPLDLNSPYARDIANHIHPQTNLRQHESQGPLVIDHGEGIYVVDSEGNRLIEGMGGMWCTSLGFSEKRLAEAAKRQMDRLPYMQVFAHRSTDPVIELAAQLTAMAPGPGPGERMDKALFACSGSEANDTAMKLVWYYHHAIGKPEKRKIIARRRAYHGTTIASASLTGLPNMHQDFNLPLSGVLHVTCPHFYREGQPGETEAAFVERLAEELEALILAERPETVGAFIAEPVMGTGGVVVPPKGYFPRIQQVLRKYEVLMIADEVICGFGRTGAMWGSERFGIQPDMLTCAKQLSSAYFPISATLVSKAIYEGMLAESDKLGNFSHGFTYGGHPVGAAVALETLAIYRERDIVGHVRQVSPRLLDGLRALQSHPLVGEVRGVGLMAAMELVQDKESRASFPAAQKVPGYLASCVQKRGVLLRGRDDALLFSPPLIINESEIDTIVAAVAEGLDETLAWLRRGT